MSDNGSSRRLGQAGEERSDTERAEELLEQWGERAGRWLSRTWARAREEAEDIWAEAQSVRRGE